MKIFNSLWEHWGCLIMTILDLIIIAIIFWALATVFCGCTTTKYVPVESVRTEYRETDTTAIYNKLYSLFESMRETDVSSDSVIDRQKETVVLNEKGDTTRHDSKRIIYASSRHEKELESMIIQRDSIIDNLRLQLASVKADTVPVPYPVERELTKWEKTKMNFGGMSIGGIVVIFFTAIVWLIRKFRK